MDDRGVHAKCQYYLKIERKMQNENQKHHPERRGHDENYPDQSSSLVGPERDNERQKNLHHNYYS